MFLGGASHTRFFKSTILGCIRFKNAFLLPLSNINYHFVDVSNQVRIFEDFSVRGLQLYQKKVACVLDYQLLYWELPYSLVNERSTSDDMQEIPELIQNMVRHFSILQDHLLRRVRSYS